MAKEKQLKKDLSGHERVGLDTSVFIHHFEGSKYSELTTLLLERVQDGHFTGCVSTMSLAEILVKPFQTGLDNLADLYRVIFHEMPNLEVVPVDSEIAARAAGIRAAHGFDMAQCILLASALEAQATAFVTDGKIEDDFKGLQVLALDEYL